MQAVTSVTFLWIGWCEVWFV